MMSSILVYLGGALSILWGIAHLFPTKNVVRDFGEVSDDNRNIITMEWINEGATLIFIGLLVVTVTLIDPLSVVSYAVYLLSMVMLLALALVSVFTGYKVNFLPFKLCPLIFTLSAVLILIGGIFLAPIPT
jgi:predicted RND superfamily exporter protein